MTNELIAIDVFECASVKSAHDQLIEALGNMESDAVVRRAEKSAPGEIAFGLGDTMMLFSRANSSRAYPQCGTVGGFSYRYRA